MECRSVQVERPSSSTSGGQSGGMGVELVVVSDDLGEEEEEDEDEEEVWAFVRAAQDEKEVQVRQLDGTSQ